MNYENNELLLDVGLSLSFKDRDTGKDTLILNDISFHVYNTVEPGSSAPRPQVIALLGRSGVGKTQLFRCIAGLQQPSIGGVYLGNSNTPVHEGEVGVVAQNYPLIDTRTVIDNLVRAFKIAQRRRRQKKDRGLDGINPVEISMEYLKKFDLSHIAKRRPTEISGGQRQRVAIVQQMICSRHYLLMDEPFSGLDVVAKEEAITLITEMANADELNTFIITTHDARSACAVTDRVIMLGKDRDAEGNYIPGARIWKDIDLKANDLCWVPGITRTPQFRDFVADVEEEMHNT